MANVNPPKMVHPSFAFRGEDAAPTFRMAISLGVASSHTFAVILAKEIVLELPKGQMLLFCHSGLDPWFDRLTTLSKVEGESSAVSGAYVSGYRIRSGMTGAN